MDGTIRKIARFTLKTAFGPFVAWCCTSLLLFAAYALSPPLGKFGTVLVYMMFVVQVVAALVGVAQFFHMGTTTYENTGLLIATTENDDEVLIAKNTGAEVDAANGVKASVPNAASARHAYVIYKRGTVFEVWVDGVKRGQFDAGEGFALAAGGMQVGSDHGGIIKNAGKYKAVPVEDSETGVVNVLRMYDYAISEAQAEAVFNAYPYVSEGGLYTRTVAEDGAFAQTGAWNKDGEIGTFTIPEGATVDGVFYNPSATITVEAQASLAVNATVAVESCSACFAETTGVRRSFARISSSLPPSR